MNAAEDRLSELMGAATCALDPPIDAILAAGERLGRVRRRRRRAAVAVGTAAVVLLAGAGVAAGIRMADPDHDYGAAGQVTRPSHPPVPIPDSRAPTPSPTVAAGSAVPVLAAPTAGLVPINANAAVRILQKLVAAGWKFGTYPESSTGSLLRVNVDDGFGLAQIFVGISTDANSGMDPIDCALQGPLLKAGAANSNLASCRVATDSNGDKAMEEVLTPPQSKVIIYRVIVNRSDGIALEITAQNGDPNSLATEVTRSMPPLSVGVWTAIALNREWQLDVPASLAKP